MSNPELPHNCANCYWQCNRPNKNPYRINDCGRWVPDRTVGFEQWQTRAAGAHFGGGCIGCKFSLYETDADDWDEIPMDLVQYAGDKWGYAINHCDHTCITNYDWEGSSDYIAWIKTVMIPMLIALSPDPSDYDLEDLLREALFPEQDGKPAVSIGEFDILL